MDYVWGNNESMVNSSNLPEAKLHKRHNILPFHYVRSMISRGYINLQHLALEWNELIQPFVHYSGNIAALFLDNTLEVDVSIAEGSIFGILGSEKRRKKPMTDGEQIASMYSMYTTVRRVLPVR